MMKFMSFGAILAAVLITASVLGQEQTGIFQAATPVLISVFMAIDAGHSAADSVHQESNVTGNTGYVSPYSLNYSIPKEELTFDFQKSPRNDWMLESKIPYSDWYTETTKDEFGSWGPPATQYPAVQDLNKKGKKWMQERLVAVAEKFIGYHYQHHHIPDWLLPKCWPWEEVVVGRNTKGFDCSDLALLSTTLD